MALLWKIELTKDQLALLNACEQFTDACKKAKVPTVRKDGEKRNPKRDALWSDHVYPVCQTLRASCIQSRQLSRERLIAQADGDWTITEKGRLVLQIAKMELKELDQ